ncbi:MAG: 6-bladed beta-propeller [Prevotellaceae bacterium]|nr:6-bladed beta-propeller [Prevotellaceae bacterium]
MKYTTILILLLCMQFSCMEKHHINMNTPVISMDNLIELDITESFKGLENLEQQFITILGEHRLVLLETTDDCLIGEIKKVTLTDSLIFVLDAFLANKLFVFNADGKFIRHIGSRGQGPGEYIQATDFHYDKYTKEVIIYDQFKHQMLYFDLNGNFIRTKLHNIRFVNFAKTKNEYVYKLLDNRHIPEIEDCYAAMGTDSTEVVYAALPRFEMNFYTGFTLNVLNDSIVSFARPFRDTIYHYSNGILYPKYHIKFPEKTKLPANVEKQVDHDYYKLRTRYDNLEENRTYFNGNFFETDDYLYFIIDHPYHYAFIYNKTTNKLMSGTKSHSSHGHFEPMFLFFTPVSCSNNCFITTIESRRLYDEHRFPHKIDSTGTIYKLIENIKPDDNPALFIHKFDF